MRSIENALLTIFHSLFLSVNINVAYIVFLSYWHWHL
jgi:hypothetical protein